MILDEDRRKRTCDGSNCTAEVSRLTNLHQLLGALPMYTIRRAASTQLQSCDTTTGFKNKL